MRFEMNSDAVMGICRAIANSLEGIEIQEWSTNYKAICLMDCKRLLKKVKIYGLAAFENRESFREEINELEETIRETEKTLKG